MGGISYIYVVSFVVVFAVLLFVLTFISLIVVCLLLLSIDIFRIEYVRRRSFTSIDL
jgi:hypothetical protein